MFLEDTEFDWSYLSWWNYKVFWFASLMAVQTMLKNVRLPMEKVMLLMHYSRKRSKAKVKPQVVLLKRPVKLRKI